MEWGANNLWIHTHTHTHTPGGYLISKFALEDFTTLHLGRLDCGDGHRYAFQKLLLSVLRKRLKMLLMLLLLLFLEAMGTVAAAVPLRKSMWIPIKQIRFHHEFYLLC